MECLSHLPQCVEEAPIVFFLLSFLGIVLWKAITLLTGGILLILAGLAQRVTTDDAKTASQYRFRLFGQEVFMKASIRGAVIGAGLLLALLSVVAPSSPKPSASKQLESDANAANANNKMAELRRANGVK